MKILHLLTDSSLGGAGMMLSYLAPHLLSLGELTVALPGENPLADELIRKGISVERLPIREKNASSVAYWPIYHALLSRIRPTVLHTHAAPLPRLWGRMLRIPITLTTRHCDLPAKWERSPWLRSLYDFSTDMTVSTSESLHRSLRALGLPSVLIPNGVPRPRPFTTQKTAEFRRALGLHCGDILLCTVARLVSLKGVDTVLSALPLCPPSFHLLLIGEGPERVRLTRLAEREGLSGRVHFFGLLPNAAAYLSHADLLVTASRGSETSPLVIAEAASLGIPTVASDIPGHRERLSGGGGLLFPVDDERALADCLIKAIKEPMHRHLSQEAARNYESALSDRLMGERYRALYTELLSKKRLKNPRRRGMIKI